MTEPENRTELGNARRLVRRHGHRIRFVHAWGHWLVFRDGRWAKDDTAEVERLAKETVCTIYGEAEAASTRSVVVVNKSDLPAAWDAARDMPEAILVSAVSGDGLDALRMAIVRALTGGEPRREAPAITNVRHVELLNRARAALARGAAAARQGTPEEFVLTDLHGARGALEEVTGARTAEDTLAAIFSRFCIGK